MRGGVLLLREKESGKINALDSGSNAPNITSPLWPGMWVGLLSARLLVDDWRLSVERILRSVRRDPAWLFRRVSRSM